MRLNLTDLEILKNSANFNLLNNLLIEAKKLSKLYYIDGEFDEEYENYIGSLMYYRSKMTPKYICDVSVPNVCPNQSDIINYIVTKTRERLLYLVDDKYKSIDEVDLTNGCILSSLYVKEECDKLGIDCEIIELYPGYNKDARLFGNTGYHHFNIIRINSREYLVDVSYKQFFKESHCNLEEIGVPFMCAPSPGTFMLLDEERKKVAEKILKDGWIEITNQNLKHYCDGFTWSFRNGLYYEIFQPTNYNTEYSQEDYLNFLFSKDNQINHEQRECLGPLKVPINEFTKIKLKYQSN